MGFPGLGTGLRNVGSSSFLGTHWSLHGGWSLWDAVCCVSRFKLKHLNLCHNYETYASACYLNYILLNTNCIG
ncbi:hypothetical protein Hanom_Chr10g00906721 [Helianthus anomalus]